MSEDVKGPTGIDTVAVVVSTPWASEGRMAKYCIRAIPIPTGRGDWMWLARAPYRTWRMFGSWEEAALYLKIEKVAHDTGTDRPRMTLELS